MNDYRVARQVKTTANVILILGLIAATIYLGWAVVAENWLQAGLAGGIIIVSIWQRMLLYGVGELIGQAQTIAQNTQNSGQPAAASQGDALMHKLEELKRLKDNNVLTAQEYEKKKLEILNTLYQSM